MVSSASKLSDDFGGVAKFGSDASKCRSVGLSLERPVRQHEVVQFGTGDDGLPQVDHLGAVAQGVVLVDDLDEAIVPVAEVDGLAIILMNFELTMFVAELWASASIGTSTPSMIDLGGGGLGHLLQHVGK